MAAHFWRRKIGRRNAFITCPRCFGHFFSIIDQGKGNLRDVAQLTRNIHDNNLPAGFPK